MNVTETLAKYDRRQLLKLKLVVLGMTLVDLAYAYMIWIA